MQMNIHRIIDPHTHTPSKELDKNKGLVRWPSGRRASCPSLRT